MNSRRMVSLPCLSRLGFFGVRTRKTRFRGHGFPYIDWFRVHCVWRPSKRAKQWPTWPRISLTCLLTPKNSVYKPAWLHSPLEMQSQRMNWSATHATKCSRWLIECWWGFQTWDDTVGVVQNSAMRRVLLILEKKIWSFEKIGGSIWNSNTNINRQSSCTVNGDSLFSPCTEQKGRRIKNSQELLDSESRA